MKENKLAFIIQITFSNGMCEHFAYIDLNWEGATQQCKKHMEHFKDRGRYSIHHESCGDLITPLKD